MNTYSFLINQKIYSVEAENEKIASIKLIEKHWDEINIAGVISFLGENFEVYKTQYNLST